MSKPTVSGVSTEFQGSSTVAFQSRTAALRCFQPPEPLCVTSAMSRDLVSVQDVTSRVLGVATEVMVTAPELPAATCRFGLGEAIGSRPLLAFHRDGIRQRRPPQHFAVLGVQVLDGEEAVPQLGEPLGPLPLDLQRPGIEHPLALQ